MFAFRQNTNNKDKLEQKGTNSQKKLVPCTAFAKKLLIDELLYARSTLDLYAKKTVDMTITRKLLLWIKLNNYSCHELGDPRGKS